MPQPWLPRIRDFLNVLFGEPWFPWDAFALNPVVGPSGLWPDEISSKSNDFDGQRAWGHEEDFMSPGRQPGFPSGR